MSLASLMDLPSEPDSDACKKSYWILGAAHQTASELLDLFDKPGGQKRVPGNPSNTDQDLLRSMLIFAGAGLDAAIKQLIKEAFLGIVESDDAVRAKVIEHFSKHLSRSEMASTKDLVRWLFEEKPRTAMINDLIKELTSDSLQSKTQIEKVIDYLKLDRRKILLVDDSILKATFDARNMIIHELDVDFSKQPRQGQRTRTQRQRSNMVDYTNAIFEIAVGFLNEVDAKLSS
jgi:hypothetical protein